MSNRELLNTLLGVREVFQRRSVTPPLWLERAIEDAQAERITECVKTIDLGIVPYRFEDPEVFLPAFTILQGFQTAHAA